MTLQLHVKISTLYTKLKSQRGLGTDYMEIFYPVMKFQLGSPSLDFYDYKKTTQRDNQNADQNKPISSRTKKRASSPFKFKC